MTTPEEAGRIPEKSTEVAIPPMTSEEYQLHRRDYGVAIQEATLMNEAISRRITELHTQDAELVALRIEELESK